MVDVQDGALEADDLIIDIKISYANWAFSQLFLCEVVLIGVCHVGAFWSFGLLLVAEEALKHTSVRIILPFLFCRNPFVP